MIADARRDPFGLSGTTLADKYRMGDVVGEGGFSVVYAAEHLIWQQPVAIKCFKALANAPLEQRQRLLDGFIQEGKLMAQLSSRSAAIVQARDVGTFTSRDGQWIPYMVLEWLDGKSLEQVLWHERQAGLPPRTISEAIQLLEPAAVALELVHTRNIAHRDLKPANIFVLGDARGGSAFVKVLDFGIAKVMAEHAEHAAALAATGSEITSFTPNYGAPEQFSRTHGATGPWTDVFAMALMLIEVLRGGLAALEGGDFVQLAVASRDPEKRPTPRAFGLAVSDAVESVFRTALAVSPSERYPSMGRFWAALSAAANPDAPAWSMGRGSGVIAALPLTGSSPRISATPEAGTGPVAITPPSSASLAHSSPSAQSLDNLAETVLGPAPAPKRRSASLLWAGLGLGVLLVGGAAYTRFSSRPLPSPGPSATPSTAPPATPSVVPLPSVSPPRKTECPEGMVLVPGGKFFMGSDDPSFKLWQPAHKVTIDTFCIDIYEVTAKSYLACSNIGECKRPEPIPSYPKADGVTDEQHEKSEHVLAELCNFDKPDRESHPINCVSWALADEYCRVNKKRLPTEAEWEFAARGSDGRKFPWGNDPGDQEHMNACGLECNRWEAAHGLPASPRMYAADDGFPGTAPVGSFPKGKTRFGAYDFVGNVWEWTADWFETYKPDETINPKGAPLGDRKAIRGGGFNGGVALWLNPAFRYHQLATASAPAIGFRCAASL